MVAGLLVGENKISALHRRFARGGKETELRFKDDGGAPLRCPLRNRFEEPGMERDQPLAVARDIAALAGCWCCAPHVQSGSPIAITSTDACTAARPVHDAEQLPVAGLPDLQPTDAATAW